MKDSETKNKSEAKIQKILKIASWNCGGIKNMKNSEIKRENLLKEMSNVNNALNKKNRTKMGLKNLNKRDEISELIENGIIFNNKDKVTRIQEEYFKKLYQSKGETTKEDWYIKMKEQSKQTKIMYKISEKEVEESLKKRKDNSPGPDSIRGQTLKICSKSKILIGKITEIMNEIRVGRFEKEMKVAEIINIYKKKGDKNTMESYRSISLLSNIWKTFTYIINNGIEKKKEEGQIKQYAKNNSACSDANIVIQKPS